MKAVTSIKKNNFIYFTLGIFNISEFLADDFFFFFINVVCLTTSWRYITNLQYFYINVRHLSASVTIFFKKKMNSEMERQGEVY